MKATYTCYSIPPDGILIGAVYEIGSDKNGTYYSNGKNKVYADKEYINMLFTEVKKNDGSKED
jgi:hypothetical protein